MKLPFACLAVAVLPAALTAQSVSVSLQSLTGIGLSRTEAGVVTPAQMPAGPLGSWGGIATGPFTSAMATVGWNSRSTTRNATVWLAQDLLSNGGGSSAQVDAHEFLVTFTPNGTVPSVLRITRASSVTAGTAFPGIGIDLGNTGIALPIGVNTITAGMPALGTQPLEVRVVFDAAMVSYGAAFSQLEFELLPDNRLSVVQSAISCLWPGPLSLEVAPSFEQRGVELTPAVTQGPSVLVIGWSASPFLLPTPAPLPCLVVPSPDVLLLMPPNVSVSVPVPLPDAVRPAAFHAQAVTLSSIGLLTGDAYVIGAF